MKSKQITESSVNDLIFDANSGEWWVENGAFKALHSFNLIRLNFLLTRLTLIPIKHLKVKKSLMLVVEVEFSVNPSKTRCQCYWNRYQ